MATGKLLTDILAGVLELHSKAAPKYGSEKSGAPTNYYITLSPEPVLQSNAEIEDVEIVVSPDHKVFSHSNPLRGLVEGGTFILQSQLSPIEVWKELPAQARKTIRDKKIKFFVLDGFAVAKPHAPTPELETRMMGIAFIGAICGHVDRITAGASQEAMLKKIRQQISPRSSAPRAARSSKATSRSSARPSRRRRRSTTPSPNSPRRRRRPRKANGRTRGDFRLDVPGGRAGGKLQFPRRASITTTWWRRRSATAPSPKRRSCRAPACSCRRAAPPSRTRACSAATCRSSSPISAPAAWNAR